LKSNFENLRVYQLSEKVAALKPLLGELGPMLNAHLKSIGPVTGRVGSGTDTATDH